MKKEKETINDEGTSKELKHIGQSLGLISVLALGWTAWHLVAFVVNLFRG